MSDIKNTEASETVVASESTLNDLLSAYRFVFARSFHKDKEMMAALQTWQPGVYKIIDDDIYNSQE